MMPYCGRYLSGWQVMSEPAGRPSPTSVMNPPFRITSGFAMKWSGRQKTRSATLPGVTEPTYESMPMAVAGLIVTFAR